jgi:hypothetical protein
MTLTQNSWQPSRRENRIARVVSFRTDPGAAPGAGRLKRRLCIRRSTRRSYCRFGQASDQSAMLHERIAAFLVAIAALMACEPKGRISELLLAMSVVVNCSNVGVESTCARDQAPLVPAILNWTSFVLVFVPVGNDLTAGEDLGVKRCGNLLLVTWLRARLEVRLLATTRSLGRCRIEKVITCTGSKALSKNASGPSRKTFSSNRLAISWKRFLRRDGTRQSRCRNCSRPTRATFKSQGGAVERPTAPRRRNSGPRCREHCVQPTCSPGAMAAIGRPPSCGGRGAGMWAIHDGDAKKLLRTRFLFDFSGFLKDIKRRVRSRSNLFPSTF